MPRVFRTVQGTLYRVLPPTPPQAHSCAGRWYLTRRRPPPRGNSSSPSFRCAFKEDQ